METFLNRYRNPTVLLLVIFAQLLLLAFQVKNDQDVRMIRLWTVSAVTPFARVVEWLRGGSIGFMRDYILLHDTHLENRRLQTELDRLKLENNFLKNELATADIERLRRAGRSPLSAHLGAEQGTISAKAAVSEGKARLANDQVDLFLALGGGW